MLCCYIAICRLTHVLYKTLQKPYISIEDNYMEMLQLKRLEMNKLFFLFLIKLDSLNTKKITFITACDKLTSLDTVRTSKPEIPDPNTCKLPKEL